MAAWDTIPGCESMEFRSPDGSSIQFLTLAGVTGRMFPPVQLTSIPVPAGHGSRFRGAAHLERLVVLPVAAPGIFEGRDELRRWAKVLDPAKGEGTLTVIEGEHAGRQLQCAYEAGLDEMEESARSPLTPTLLFKAAYPYWIDSGESEQVVTQDDTTFTWFPFLPLVLGASDAFAVFTVTNQGDVTTWPVVTVTGPASEVEATNETTGEFWHVTGDVLDGEVLTVDTRPGVKTVDLDGVNSFDRLTEGSSLWGLAPGANRVEIAGATTTAVTAIRFAWRNAYLAA